MQDQGCIIRHAVCREYAAACTARVALPKAAKRVGNRGCSPRMKEPRPARDVGAARFSACDLRRSWRCQPRRASGGKRRTWSSASGSMKTARSPACSSPVDTSSVALRFDHPDRHDGRRAGALADDQGVRDSDGRQGAIDEARALAQHRTHRHEAARDTERDGTSGARFVWGCRTRSAQGRAGRQRASPHQTCSNGAEVVSRVVPG